MRARIVTSHDDIRLIEFQVPASRFQAGAYKRADHILKRAQARLAGGVGVHRGSLSCYYSSAIPLEVADSVLKPRRCRAAGRIAPAAGWRWWRWSVRASLAIRYTATRFWQQLKVSASGAYPQSEEGISLVAVLRTGPTGEPDSGAAPVCFPRRKNALA
ncbi:hypothetical protein KCP69_01555 [Salmonella enterica subsp. enterica]|nr:hypothetical protein KCP69_01555 [Salmonella enterica subsp. enterica]